MEHFSKLCLTCIVGSHAHLTHQMSKGQTHAEICLSCFLFPQNISPRLSSFGNTLFLLVSISMHPLLLIPMSGLFILEHIIIWLSINAILLLVMIVTPIFFSVVGDVGSITTKEYNIHFNNVLCVPSLCCNLQLKYQITHSSKGRIVEFSSHQVVIKDLKDPKHVLAFGIIYQNVQVFMYKCNVNFLMYKHVFQQKKTLSNNVILIISK